MRVEESAIIHRPAAEVFTFLENRANDTACMASIMSSEWLESGGKACLGRRGRMVNHSDISPFRRNQQFASALDLQALSQDRLG